MPVVSTTTVADPDTTLVPMNTRLAISSALSPFPSWMASGNFSTGRDSPVMADWLTNRSLATITRQSAGIMSPADSMTMSPGTSCLIGSSTWPAGWMPGTVVLPCRITVALLLTSSFSARAAWLERRSCTKRIRVDSATMLPITIAALMSLVNQDTRASKVSSRLNGFL